MSAGDRKTPESRGSCSLPFVGVPGHLAPLLAPLLKPGGSSRDVESHEQVVLHLVAELKVV